MVDSDRAKPREPFDLAGLKPQDIAALLWLEWQTNRDANGQQWCFEKGVGAVRRTSGLAEELARPRSFLEQVCITCPHAHCPAKTGLIDLGNGGDADEE